MRLHHVLLGLTIVAAAGCASSGPRDTETKAWKGELVSYRKAISPDHGTVGYVKEFEYTRPGFGEPFRLFHVYDLDLAERGIVSPNGTAKKFVTYPPDIAVVVGKSREEVELGAQPLAYNVARILDLDIPPGVTLAPARPSDFASVPE